MSEPIATNPPGSGVRETDPVTLDVRGLNCPLPVLKARKALKSLETGQVLRLISTDPVASLDVPHFCLEAGHALLSQSENDGELVFEIRKAG